MKEKILDEDFEESPFEYSVYGGGYGKSFEHLLYEEYKNKIDKNSIITSFLMNDKRLKRELKKKECIYNDVKE